MFPETGVHSALQPVGTGMSYIGSEASGVCSWHVRL
jgi:hypothetical protein